MNSTSKLVSLVTLCLLASCSTVRLTPRAADIAARGEEGLAEGIGEIRSQIEAKREEQTELLVAMANVRAAAGEVWNLESGEQLDYPPLTESVEDLMRTEAGGVSFEEAAREVVALARAGGAEEARVNALAEAITQLGGHRDEALKREIDSLESDLQQLNSILDGRYEYFVEGSIYFSVEPVVAIEEGLRTTAIPSLGVNWRPFPRGTYGSALGLQLLLGGALNPSNEESAMTGAIGAGLSYPIGGSGAFSFGAISWDDGDQSQVAPYFSVTLGDFARSAD